MIPLKHQINLINNIGRNSLYDLLCDFGLSPSRFTDGTLNSPILYKVSSGFHGVKFER